MQRQLIPPVFPSDPVERDAVISQDGVYRYILKRRWCPGPLLPFVMLNPSTADHMIDDPTIRACCDFARRESASGILVVNLFAIRSADPTDLGAALRAGDNANGPHNDGWIHGVAKQAWAEGWPMVMAWGAFDVDGKVRERARVVVNLLGSRADLRPAMVCLGLTKAGEPRHPLYVKRDTPLEQYVPGGRTGGV